MSDSTDVVVAAISGFAAIAASWGAGSSVLAARRAKSASEDAAVIKREVKNDHQTNMREEQDTRHAENGKKLDQIISTQRDHGQRLQRLEGSEEAHDERLQIIEHTIPPHVARNMFMPPARHRREETE